MGQRSELPVHKLQSNSTPFASSFCLHTNLAQNSSTNSPLAAGQAPGSFPAYWKNNATTKLESLPPSVRFLVPSSSLQLRQSLSFLSRPFSLLLHVSRALPLFHDYASFHPCGTHTHVRPCQIPAPSALCFLLSSIHRSLDHSIFFFFFHVSIPLRCTSRAIRVQPPGGFERPARPWYSPAAAEAAAAAAAAADAEIVLKRKSVPGEQ